MGQLDNTNPAAVDTTKLTLSGIQFHDVHGSASDSGGAATHSGNPAARLDLNSIINAGVARSPQPAAAPERIVQPAPRQVTDAPVVISPVASSPVTYPDTTRTTVADANPPRPPHPDETLSAGEQVGGLVTSGAAILASTFAYSRLKSSVKADQINKTLELSEVTDPATLEKLRAETSALSATVQGKSDAADKMVEQLAQAKPDAFGEVTELLPAKGPGQPPGQYVYHVPKDVRALTQEELALPEEQQALLRGNLSLTEDELALTDRAEYLRSLNKVLGKSFDIGNTSKTSAFRIRKDSVYGLGDTDAAEAEGLSAPLKNVEGLTRQVMDQSEKGIVKLDTAASSKIFNGAAMLAGSFVATRGIDHFLYGGKSQGFLTTAFDCAAPFVVLTNMSPLAKIGVMIGGHEAVHAIEYFTAKNKDKSE
jgi:hypothetical protein